MLSNTPLLQQGEGQKVKAFWAELPLTEPVYVST